MAPTIIVGDDENAGDVAARLLDLADRQRDVRTRTDLSSPAFEVPEAVYDKYVGRAKRSDEERRTNQQATMQAEADAPTVVTSDDELPEAARVADPADVGDKVAGQIEGDELPDSAKVVDPPSNGDAPDSGDGDQVEEQPKPKPARKRAPRKATAAKKTTPAAAGSGE